VPAARRPEEHALTAADALREIGPAADRRPLRGSGYMVRRRRDIIQMTTARTITTKMIHQ
jgi:hypothetical protein